MATYFFETITAAHALALGAGDTICFARRAGDSGESGGGSGKESVEPLGSTTFGKEVAVGDKSYPASHVVDGALSMSGLSVAQWNALGQEEVDKRLTAVLEAMNDAWRAARGSSGSVVFDPLQPGKATLRMAQSVTVHHQELDGDGKPHGPHIPYSLKVGLNHDVPQWVAEHEFVRENLAK